MNTRTFACLFALCLSTSSVACGGSDASDEGTPSAPSKGAIDPQLGGKSDQDTPPVVEAGRFLKDGTRSGTFDGKELPAFRVASFGGTRVRVTLDATDGGFDPVLVVDGPFPGSSPSTIAYNDDASGETMNSALELTLEQKGVYRLVVGSYAAFQGLPPESGAYELSFSCLEGCEPQQMSLGEFIERLKADHGEDVVEQLLLSKAPAMFQDPEVAAVVKSQAEQLLSGAGPADVFPVIPLSAVPTAQGFLEMAVEAEDTASPEPVVFDLDALLHESCTPDRGGPAVLLPEIPELERGSETDYRFDDCSLLHAQQFAEVLNNLALDNGSAVVAGEDRYETVESAIRALVKAGHRIEARNNRYYADFLGLSYDGIPVTVPLWVDTGIPLPSGGNLVVPAPHSHYHFVIEGPLLNAEVMFYMGIPGGVAFRAHHTYRKPWAGERTSLRRTTDGDLETVVSLFVTAAQLRKKWLSEGAGLPVEGYGQLGVCMDSTAVLELATENTVTLYPLLHPAIDGTPSGEIETLLSALPSDAAGTGADTALDRLIASQPFDVSGGVDLGTMPFPTLASELADLGY